MRDCSVQCRFLPPRFCHFSMLIQRKSVGKRCANLSFIFKKRRTTDSSNILFLLRFFFHIGQIAMSHRTPHLHMSLRRFDWCLRTVHFKKT